VLLACPETRLVPTQIFKVTINGHFG